MQTGVRLDAGGMSLELERTGMSSACTGLAHGAALYKGRAGSHVRATTSAKGCQNVLRSDPCQCSIVGRENTCVTYGTTATSNDSACCKCVKGLNGLFTAAVTVVAYSSSSGL